MEFAAIIVALFLSPLALHLHRDTSDAIYERSHYERKCDGIYGATFEAFVTVSGFAPVALTGG